MYYEVDHENSSFLFPLSLLQVKGLSSFQVSVETIFFLVVFMRFQCAESAARIKVKKIFYFTRPPYIEALTVNHIFSLAS